MKFDLTELSNNMNLTPQFAPESVCGQYNYATAMDIYGSFALVWQLASQSQSVSGCVI